MIADVIVLPGKVWTGERSRPSPLPRARPLADALAWRAGRLIHVGDRAGALSLRGPGTRVVEAPGTCALPGFHDAHVHLTQYGLELGHVRLDDAATLDEALRRVEARVAATPRGAWVLGAGFALQRWGVPTLRREDLDRVAPHHPVVLRSQDHHSAWVNSAALAAAGVDRATPDPEHGTIERDADGVPSGLLLETAFELVRDRAPVLGATALGTALDAAGADLAARGVTTVHHMAFEPADHWRALASKASRADGAPYPLRVWAAIPHADLEAAAAIGLAGGQGGDFFVVGGAKFFADGALGSRTAWMLDPYPDGTFGVTVDAPERLLERYALAIRAGFAPVTHAIGDAANRAVIDVLEATAPAWRAAGLRPRLEHAQHLHQADVARLSALGVVASMQPSHLVFDAASIHALFPDRRDHAYRLRDLADAGVPLAFGSDAPVAPPDPFAGLRAAVRRQGEDARPLGADQALTVDEALHAYTGGAAYAIGREARSGTLRVGADADVVILDHDPSDGLDDLSVRATFLAGEATFDAL